MSADSKQSTLTETFILNRWWWFAPLLLWAVLIVWSLSSNIDKIKRNNLDLAKHSAQNIYRMVYLVRLWNARHGGVYVPITPATQPNPYLELPNRDLKMAGNIDLTMVNPAFMTRQLSELLREDSPVRFNITSLKPLRPQNKADAWEVQALQQFEEDVDEVYERIRDKDQHLFRYMAPLLVKKPCLKCHQQQGYEVGDIRGGVSVTLDGEYLFGNQDDDIRLQSFNHLAAFMLVSLILLLFFEKMRFQWKKLRFIEQQQEQTIKDRTRELEMLATKDALTGLYNRKALDEHLQAEVDRAERYQHDLAVFMLDIDHFKRINDSYSHLVGDRVLKEIAQVLLKIIRTSDFAARFGGEEFTIVLPETSLKMAGKLAERLRREIGGLKIENEDADPFQITTSIGVAVFSQHAQTSQGLMSKADAALYRAKNEGRNRVVLAEPK